MDRRTFLIGLGSLGIGTLAGCYAPENNSLRTTSPSDMLSVTESEIVTTRTECQSTEGERSTVEIRDDQIVIEGTGVTPNPCHRAVINSTEITDHILTIAIGFKQTDELCIECIGAIGYRATVTVTALEDLEEIRVKHANGDHMHTKTIAR